MARPKPATAAWIARERKRLGLKPADLVTRLAAQSITVSEQTVRVWESNADRRPSAQNLDALERIFGSQAPERATTADDLAASIRELAEAIRQERAERIEWERGLLESLQALALALAQRDGPEPAPLGGAQR